MKGRRSFPCVDGISPRGQYSVHPDTMRSSLIPVCPAGRGVDPEFIEFIRPGFSMDMETGKNWYDPGEISGEDACYTGERLSGAAIQAMTPFSYR
jgi:hypothetical protein